MESHGRGVAFCFSWENFFTQMLWLLCAMTTPCLIYGADPIEWSGGCIDEDPNADTWLAKCPQDHAHLAWNIFRFLLVLWAGAVFYLTGTLENFMPVGADKSVEDKSERTVKNQ